MKQLFSKTWLFESDCRRAVHLEMDQLPKNVQRNSTFRSVASIKIQTRVRRAAQNQNTSELVGIKQAAAVPVTPVSKVRGGVLRAVSVSTCESTSSFPIQLHTAEKWSFKIGIFRRKISGYGVLTLRKSEPMKTAISFCGCRFKKRVTRRIHSVSQLAHAASKWTSSMSSKRSRHTHTYAHAHSTYETEQVAHRYTSFASKNRILEIGIESIIVHLEWTFSYLLAFLLRFSSFAIFYFFFS